MAFRRELLLLAAGTLLSGLAVLAVFSSGGVSAQTPQAPARMATSNYMTPPPTVYPPTQADDGAQVYYLRCMTCHGDRGQGLTVGWRNQIGAPDTDCWTSHCHASNRTDTTFSFPRTVPALVGPDVLPGFSDAYNLYSFIHTWMPYQAPGSLSDAQYWQLTAFLLRANGVAYGPQPLDAARARAIRFSPPVPAEPGSPVFTGWPWLAGGALVVLAAGGLLLLRGRFR